MGGPLKIRVIGYVSGIVESVLRIERPIADRPHLLPHFRQPGYEKDLLYLASLAALVLDGSGPFALDRLRRDSRQ